MTHALQRLSQGLLAAFLIIGLALGYWSIVRRDSLIVRPDNPRRVLDEQRIQRGRILDRNDTALAENRVDAETGLVTRIAHYPVTVPVTGYVSLRYGVGGIEAAFDDHLRGDAALTPYQISLNNVLHRPQVGGDVRLTLDVDLQRSAAAAMGDYNGAVVLLSVPEGHILALVSQPGFDPELLDDTWDALSEDPDAPLLNRVTQGLYQPGAILQSVLLGETLNNNLDVESMEWTGDPASDVGGARLNCNGSPPRIDSPLDAFLWGCPAPFQPLAEGLGADRFALALQDFRLLEAPTFTLPTESDPDASGRPADLATAALGQGDLTVSPLQMALVAASFANHGQIPPLQLVEALRPPGGDWETVVPPGGPLGTISPTHSDEVSELMARAVNEGGAQAAAIPGEQVYGHAGLAIGGPQGALNGWFIGFVNLPDGSSLAVAALVENTEDVTAAARIGGEVLAAGLDAAP